jgi:hypothetical protein
MANHRRKAWGIAGLALLGVWLVLGAGWFFSHRAKATAEKVAVYLHEKDLSMLTGEARARALRDLSRQMIELPVEERRRARQDEAWEKWFAAMTDREKSEFIEATLPSGVKQMIASFEQLPEDKRRKAVTDSLREMRKTREALASGDSEVRVNTNRPAELSEEVQKQMVQLGLKTFYTESSAQTKAEVAPVLEEMQRLMESGALLRGQRR